MSNLVRIGVPVQVWFIFLDVCYLRLDFESFTIVGPTLSTEGVASTYTCPDSLKVTVSKSLLSEKS